MKKILDACCGGRMFWFDKKDDRVLFMDNRRFKKQTIYPGRTLEVDPDLKADFRDMPFRTRSFHLVVFDPPQLVSAGKNGWMGKKYGSLDSQTWREDLKKGFSECFRVLKKNGVLIFKWNETDIPLSDVLALTKEKPLFGHVSGKQQRTHWVAFIK